MPIFEVQGPDGATYEVDAPDENAAVSAFQRFSGPKDAGHSNVPEFDPGVEGYNPKTGMVENPRSKGASAAYGAADIMGLGFGDELSAGVGSTLSGKPYDQVLSEIRGNQAKAQRDNPVSYLGGQVAGGLAQAAIGGAGPFMSRSVGSTLGKTALASGADTALLTGAYGAGSGENATDRMIGAGLGAGLGFGVGAATPYLVKGASELGRRVISPFTSSPERQAAASVLAREGIETTAGQKTGSDALRYAESELGGRKAANLVERQGEQFTDAAMRRAGGSGNATSDNLLSMSERLSKGFEDISKRNTMKADGQFLTDFVDTLKEYNRVLPSEQKQILGNIASDIGDKIKAGNGTISGKDYQTFRSRLSKRAQNARGSDNELADAYRGLRNALDSAMDRSINVNDKGVWQTLRRQYGNMKVLQDAATRSSSEASGLGIISPAQLSAAARSGKNKAQFATGKSDFAELAKAGQALLKPLPNSGTAGRLRAQNLAAMAPTVIGAGYGGIQGGDLTSAALGAGVGYALPKALGGLLMSKPGQAYLANQLLTGSLPPVVANRAAGLLDSVLGPQALQAVR